MTGSRFRNTAATVSPTRTSPIAVKMTIFLRFLLFGFAICVPRKTPDIQVLFQVIESVAADFVCFFRSGPLQGRTRDCNLSYRPHPGRVDTSTSTTQIANNQVAALPKETPLNFDSATASTARYQSIIRFTCER